MHVDNLTLLLCSLNPGLFALIQSGKLGDALGHQAVINIGTPVVHTLIHLMEHVDLKPDRVSLLHFSFNADESNSVHLVITTDYLEYW